MFAKHFIVTVTSPAYMLPHRTSLSSLISHLSLSFSCLHSLSISQSRSSSLELPTATTRLVGTLLITHTGLIIPKTTCEKLYALAQRLPMLLQRRGPQKMRRIDRCLLSKIVDSSHRIDEGGSVGMLHGTHNLPT